MAKTKSALKELNRTLIEHKYLSFNDKNGIEVEIDITLRAPESVLTAGEIKSLSLDFADDAMKSIADARYVGAHLSQIEVG